MLLVCILCELMLAVLSQSSVTSRLFMRDVILIWPFYLLALLPLRDTPLCL